MIASIPGPPSDSYLPFEAFHDEDVGIAEHTDLAANRAHAKRLVEARGEPLVLHRAAHVDAQAADPAERKLEDMRRRRRSQGNLPLPFMVEERGLLLGAGYRYSEGVIGCLPSRSHRLRDALEDRVDLG